MILDVTARAGIDAETLEQEVVLVRSTAFRTTGVTAAEVERARALIETDFVASMQSAAERADKLSQFATYFGDPALVNAQVDRYRSVTLRLSRRSFCDALGPDNRATLLFIPQETATTSQPAAAAA